ncbi:MAG: hypothetical protein A2X94_15220 [Bdellovibrionales bacterium GWB1_55_8]|nr:MAG: hypothetical protein A2X94_15220 [Bdellovibrionales bacterium GWB1_55_8]
MASSQKTSEGDSQVDHGQLPFCISKDYAGFGEVYTLPSVVSADRLTEILLPRMSSLVFLHSSLTRLGRLCLLSGFWLLNRGRQELTQLLVTIFAIPDLVAVAVT